MPILCVGIAITANLENDNIRPGRGYKLVTWPPTRVVPSISSPGL